MKAETGMKGRRRGDPWRLLIVPPLLLLAIAFLVPLAYIIFFSISGSLANDLAMILQKPVYLRVIFSTLQVAAIVTLICLLLAYPYAYAMNRSRGLTLALLAIVLLLPFWLSLLLRTFSWIVLLQDTGFINRSLMAWGLIDAPIKLIRNRTGLIIGMAHLLLPYMIFPILNTMKKIEDSLLDASAICGAGRLRTFFRVYLPLSVPGIISGAVLVFTLSLGFYITPALLGGPRDTMISQLIAGQVHEQLNFGFASSLAVVLLVVVAACFLVFGLASRRFMRRFATR